MKTKSKKVDRYPVIFRKDKRNGRVVAFFPETIFDGSVNYGCIMSYVHNGQSSEAKIEYYYNDTKSCEPSDYADLLKELKWYFNQDTNEPKTVLRVMKRICYGCRRLWPFAF